MQNEYSEQRKGLNQTKDRVRSLEKTKDAAAKRLTDTRQARELDEDIERIRAEQAQRKIQQADFSEVGRKREYFNLLGQANLALPHVLSLLNDAESEQKNVTEQEAKAQEASRKSTELQHTVAEAEKRMEEVQKEVERLELLKREREEKQELYQAIIQERNKAIEAGECPTCGLDMSGNIGTHVHEEVHNLEQQIEELKTDLQSISSSLTMPCSELERLKGNIEHQKREIRKLDAQANLATAQKAAQKARAKRDAAETRWQRHLTKWQVIQAPDWLTPSDASQARIAQELQALATIEAKYNQLRDMQSTFQAQESLLDRYKSDRSRLSVLSPIPETLLADLEQELEEAEERLESAGNERDDLEKMLKLIEEKGKKSRQERDEAKQREIRADKHLDGLNITQQNDETNLSKIRARLVGEQQKLACQFPELAADLLLAIDDSEVHLRLKRTAKSSAEEALKLGELQEAEAQSTRVQAEIDVKQADLNSLLDAVGQRTEVQASSELDELQDELKQLDKEVTNADRDVEKTERDYLTLQEVGPQLEVAKSQSWAYKQIEDALYPGTTTKPSGVLREQITQNLMERIALEASHILQDLGWHMAIVYSKQDGFSVKDKNYDVVRQYKQFSGGERFAVAIAVALAVGQATHGAGNIRCLFIDEGFGALDANNRSRITTDAIGKLIEKGWRDQVVVITHLDDMKEHFPHRIELKKEDDYSVLVKPTEAFL